MLTCKNVLKLLFSKFSGIDDNRCESDVLKHGFVVEQIEMLEDHAHLAAVLVQIDALGGDVNVVDIDLAGGGLFWPPVGSSIQFKQRRNVLFPEPDGPITTTISPLFILMLMPSRTLLFPKDFSRLITSITFLQTPFH